MSCEFFACPGVLPDDHGRQRISGRGVPGEAAFARIGDGDGVRPRGALQNRVDVSQQFVGAVLRPSGVGITLFVPNASIDPPGAGLFDDEAAGRELEPDLPGARRFGRHGPEPGSPFGPNLRGLVTSLRFTRGVAFERLSRPTTDLSGLSVSEDARVSILMSARAWSPPSAPGCFRDPVICSDGTGLWVGERSGRLSVFRHGENAFVLTDPRRS